MEETRKRVLPFEGANRVTRVTRSGGPKVPTTESTAFQGVSWSRLEGKQITASETHPEWFSRKEGSFKGDVGGNFSTFRQSAECYSSDVAFTTMKLDSDKTWVAVDYRGAVLPINPSNTTWPSDISSSDEKLEELGTTAIARCSPTNPSLDLTTTVGELVKEGLPKLAGSAIFKKNATHQQRLKAIGDEHLNFSFGYQPLANDMADIANRIVSGDKAIRQYQRDAGKLVRRRYEFPIEQTVKHTSSAYNAIPHVPGSISNMFDTVGPLGRTVRIERSYRRVWFSGAFTYVVPPADADGIDGVARSVIMAKKSLGLRLTPTAIWNLTPWSWAADWFSNAGDYLTNLDAWIIDGQVLRYGYIMEHSVHEYQYFFESPTGSSRISRLIANVPPAPLTLRTEVKKRRRATPFGFGLTWEGLSTFQQSILGALGLSKASMKNGK